MRVAADWPAPRILAGDFNAIAPGDGTRLDTAPLWVRAQLWPQAGVAPRWALRPIAAAGYVDCFRALHPDGHADPGFTLPPVRSQVRLDYVFADPGAARALRRCEVFAGPTAAAGASDHLPVVAEFADLGADA